MKRFVMFALVVAASCIAAAHEVAQTSKRPRPPTPFEDAGACPFEGCVYDDRWIANRLVDIRTDRSAKAPIAFRVKRGEHVTALTGVVTTMTPGRVLLRRPVALGDRAEQTVVQPGEILYLLTYQGEGFGKVWYDGRVHSDVDVTGFDDEYCDTQPDGCHGKLLERSETVWWIQVRNGAGATAWTNQPAAFDGKDALGRSPRSQ